MLCFFKTQNGANQKISFMNFLSSNLFTFTKKLFPYTFFFLFGFTLLFSPHSQAQIQFEQVLLPPPALQNVADFYAVSGSAMAFADIDGDTDQDILISGTGNLGIASKLYRNDGNGNFSVVDSPLKAVSDGAIAFADIDGDNDQDILITGYEGLHKISYLYKNDGNGNFTFFDAPFLSVSNGSVAFADIDGDNDQDVLITGSGNSGRVCKLYKNDGSGNFTLSASNPFTAVDHSSVAFSDIDGDNDQDVLITGSSIFGGVSNLYKNDGNGNFTFVATPFTGVSYASIAFADIDGDNDQDVLITGISNLQKVSKLYKNNGSGNFTPLAGNSFTAVDHSSISFSDVDGDNDQDVLITGSGYSGYVSNLYRNDGSGNFTLDGATFTGVQDGSVAFIDIDGDNDQDMLITGHDGVNASSKLYINNGSGTLTLVSSIFTGVNLSFIAFADIDGDNDQDVLITGNADSGYVSQLYKNDGSGNFTLIDAPFIGVSSSSVAFADIDGDNDQDVLITGHSDLANVSKLYTNDGSGNFTLVGDTPFTGVGGGSIAFSDVDGDNDLDVLITGQGNYARIAELYLNDGSGNFTLVDAPFTAVWISSIAFSDVDGDNDQDVLITGSLGSGAGVVSKLYKNDGSGNFTLVDSPFTGVYYGSVAFADIDGDGDQDLLIRGSGINSQGISELYKNDGTGNFTLMASPFTALGSGSIAFADVDSDNDQDVLITGGIAMVGYSQLYMNDGGGNFTLVEVPFTGVYYSSIAFSDVDGDNDPDVLITGHDGSTGISRLYRNTTVPPMASIDGHVQWASSCSSRNITIKLYNQFVSETNLVFSTSVDAFGDFVSPQFPSGTYDILITVQGYLTKLYSDVLIEGGVNELDVFGIRAGDLNASNNVNIQDISIFNPAFGSVSGGLNYNFIADFNCDGFVNIIDLSILNISFGMVGGSFP